MKEMEDFKLPDWIGSLERVDASGLGERLVDGVQNRIKSFEKLGELELSANDWRQPLFFYLNRDPSSVDDLNCVQIVIDKLKGRKGPDSLLVKVLYSNQETSENVLCSWRARALVVGEVGHQETHACFMEAVQSIVDRFCLPEEQVGLYW